GLYKVTNHKRTVCRDVSSQKLKRNSRLAQRGKTMKRFYVPTKPKSLSAIARETGVSLGLLLRMNRGASKYMVKPGSKVLVWQCAGR
ncbi:MAG: LysM peptidoglycan-binding domain-containing protein, partial [Leucothrix sp.]